MQNFHKHQFINDTVIKYTHGTLDTTKMDGTPCKVRYTFALALNHANKAVTYSMAKSAPQDNFCKRVGRDIAGGRALKTMQYGGMSALDAITHMPENLREWAEREIKRLGWL